MLRAWLKDGYKETSKVKFKQALAGAALVGLSVVSATGSALAKDKADGAPVTYAGPIVVDSTDKVVGPYVGSRVVLTVENTRVSVQLVFYKNPITALPTTAYAWPVGHLYFATTDCTGQAYVGSNPTGSAFGFVVTRDSSGELMGQVSDGEDPSGLVMAMSRQVVSTDGLGGFTSSCQDYRSGGGAMPTDDSVPKLGILRPILTTVSMSAFGVAPLYLK